MAAVLMLLHYICIVALSIYVAFYGWSNIHGINGKNASSSSKIKIFGDIIANNDHLQNICTILNGCYVTEGQNLCHRYIQNCHGSLRCCSDCHFKWITTLNMSALMNKNKMNFTTAIPVQFIDRYYYMVYTNTIISILIIIVYVLVFILKTACIKTNLSKQSINDKNKQVTNIKPNYHYKIFNVLAAILFILIFLTSIGLTIYNIIYFIANIFHLLKCQPTFVIILTWIVLLMIHILDQIIHVSHIFTYKAYKQYVKLCGVKCLLQYIISTVSFLLIFWWIGIAIYFYGVYTNKWIISTK